MNEHDSPPTPVVEADILAATEFLTNRTHHITRQIDDLARRFAEYRISHVNEWIVAHHAPIVARLQAERNELVDRLNSGAIPNHAVCCFKDGDKWVAVFRNFINLQESPCGFGDTAAQAAVALKSQAEKSQAECPNP